MPTGSGVANVGHGSTPGHGGVDFRASRKHHIRQKQPGATHLLRRLGNGIAQFPQQLAEEFLFVGLGRVVSVPVLAVGHPHGLGLNGDAIGPLLSLNDEFHGVDVLAGLLTLLEVRAGAEGVAVHVDDIGAVAGLRRDLVAQLVLFDPRQGRYRHAALLPSGGAVVGVVGAESGNGLCLLPVHLPTSANCPYLYLQYHTLYIIVKSLTAIYIVWYCATMNEVQTYLANLRDKGWTWAAIADELGVTKNAVEKWNAGDRTPANRKSTLEHLDRLLQQKRVPKKRRYQSSVGH